MNSAVIEAIGYVGSALVLISFIMSSVVKLRVVNTIGSVIFATYAFIIRSYPTAIMNVALVIINLYYLKKLLMTEASYEFMKLAMSDKFLEFFMAHYEADIKKCYPGVDLDMNKFDQAYMVCNNANPVGVLLGTNKDGNMDVYLDYTIPEFRDCTVGRFTYHQLKSLGINSFKYVGIRHNNEDYLKKVGFVKNGEDLIL